MFIVIFIRKINPKTLLERYVNYLSSLPEEYLVCMAQFEYC